MDQDLIDQASEFPELRGLLDRYKADPNTLLEKRLRNYVDQQSGETDGTLQGEIDAAIILGHRLIDEAETEERKGSIGVHIRVLEQYRTEAGEDVLREQIRNIEDYQGMVE